MAIRDQQGYKTVIIETTTAGSGVMGAFPHGLDTSKIVSVETTLIAVDGSVIPNGNPAGVANSDYTMELDSTNYGAGAAVGATNVYSSPCTIIIKMTD